MKIVDISARKILASLGNETVEATITFADGGNSTASVPAGLSAGKYEVAKVPADAAIKQIGEIKAICVGKEWGQEELDGEISSHGFGGNATLAVSAAFWRGRGDGSFVRTAGNGGIATSFPKILLLLFEGGKHGNLNLTIQEFTVVEESVADCRQDYQKIKDYLTAANLEITVGVEGGFSPEGFTDMAAMTAIKNVLPERKIALDIAGAFVKEEPDYGQLLSGYNIISIEDPYSDEEWEKWQKFLADFGQKILVVGDDLTVTNPERIKRALEAKAISAVVIKPNQIGTISRAFEAVKIAREGGLKIFASHRGEETEDAWIVDFAVACGADYLKIGGLDRGERIAKYNRLLELGMG